MLFAVFYFTERICCKWLCDYDRIRSSYDTSASQPLSSPLVEVAHRLPCLILFLFQGRYASCYSVGPSRVEMQITWWYIDSKPEHLGIRLLHCTVQKISNVRIFEAMSTRNDDIAVPHMHRTEFLRLQFSCTNQYVFELDAGLIYACGAYSIGMRFRVRRRSNYAMVS